MTLSADQILDLAPDPASRKAGQDQAKPAKWQGLGRAGSVIWGEIKGSGAAPYRTVADPSGPAAKCTCPSRKFPCKHAIGLMLVAAAGAPPEAEPPDWVGAWIRGRESRAAAAGRAEETAKPVDARAQDRRRQARDAKVAGALDELDLWLRDLMRRGLAVARAEPYAFWDRMAGRLVDGQASGLARRVRALPGLAAAGLRPGAAAPEAALAFGVGRLALLVRAARRLDALAPEQAAGVRAAIGFPVGAEELAARPGVSDDWAVLAHTVTEEDRLTVRTVWLVGRRTGLPAQVIDFAAAAAALPLMPSPGRDCAGSLAFHPGEPPLRAVFRDGAVVAGAAALPAGGTVAQARDAFAAVLARAPWTERWPVCVAGVRLGHLAGGGGLAAGDATGCLPLRADPHLPAVLAVSAGQPVGLFGLYDGFGLQVLAVTAAGRRFAVPAQDPRPILLLAA
ncbi:SWIM zinc finger domain-containing protein [Methylobacterium sp. J-088]|uniref:SWIM zinc finger family protein n=1 Tax=Methylobacterium sp. J-088 TaxID=2836664 RepID=UPI001FB96D59|nr:SWIM zinc finger family protein [Methylobacterium sp. J-088]MCJ2064928.1 SWIM zinc finger domain-containing protein [Methylobacterium sp. J-088]